MYNRGHKIVKHFKILMWLSLPQVKWYMKSSNILYELAHELPNYLRPRIIGNLEIMGKTRKWVGAEFNSQSPIQKKILVLVVKNYTKTDISKFLVLSNFP